MALRIDRGARWSFPVAFALATLWAFALWVLFGSYVLVLWVVGVLAMAAFKIVPKRRPA